MKALMSLLPLSPVIALIIGLALFLAACGGHPAAPSTIYVKVPTPYHAPCPKAEDKPAVPKRVAQEHPLMPADPLARERILAAKVLELFGYADKADGVMDACSR